MHANSGCVCYFGFWFVCVGVGTRRRRRARMRVAAAAHPQKRLTTLAHASAACLRSGSPLFLSSITASTHACHALVEFFLRVDRRAPSAALAVGPSRTRAHTARPMLQCSSGVLRYFAISVALSKRRTPKTPCMLTSAQVPTQTASNERFARSRTSKTSLQGPPFMNLHHAHSGSDSSSGFEEDSGAAAAIAAGVCASVRDVLCSDGLNQCRIAFRSA